MRIPKFRVWDKIEKEMIEEIETIYYRENQIRFKTGWRWFKDIELLQSTGVLDINGVEIFEGDIFKIPDVYKHLDDFIGKVFWEDGAFCVSYRRSEYGRSEYFLADSLNEELEVIGNIYQNPELVEVE